MVSLRQASTFLPRPPLRGAVLASLRSLPLGVWLAGCGQGAPPGLPSDIEWTSEHFVYHARAGDPDVCPGLLELMERHFDVIHATVGLPWPEGRRIDYYKFRDQGDYAESAGCPADTGGCAYDGAAFAFEPFHQHELIHTYFEPQGSPPRILSEGVAELLACASLDLLSAANEASAEPVEPVEPAVPAGSNVLEFLEPRRDEPYVLGNILVSHLVTTYGWEGFLDLYAGAWQRRDAAELEQHFQSLYGASFDDVMATATRSRPFISCVAAWACAADPLLPGVPETPGGSCGDSGFRSLAPAEPQLLELEAEGPAVAVLECPSDPGEPLSGGPGFVGEGTRADLVQGRYVVAAEGDTRLTSSRLQEPGFGLDCEQLGSLHLDTAAAGATWLFEPRTSPYFLRLDLPIGTQLALRVEGAGPFKVCASCADDSECVPVETAGLFTVRSGAVLHFPAEAQPGHLASLFLGVQ